MWWSRRAFAAALLAAGGCGFQPALAPGGGPLRGEIAVEAPDTVAEYHLVHQLERRLGRPETPRYRLSLVVRQTSDVTGITADELVSRRNVIAEVDYALTEIASGEVVRRGTVENFTGYSATSTTVATQVGAQNAIERLMTLLADRIYYELAATADAWSR